MYFTIVIIVCFQMETDFKKQTLVSIDQQIIHKWIAITNMYSSTMLHKCLEVFSKNISLVDWLKEATNGMETYTHVCLSDI